MFSSRVRLVSFCVGVVLVAGALWHYYDTLSGNGEMREMHSLFLAGRLTRVTAADIQKMVTAKLTIDRAEFTSLLFGGLGILAIGAGLYPRKKAAQVVYQSEITIPLPPDQRLYPVAGLTTDELRRTFLAAFWAAVVMGASATALQRSVSDLEPVISVALNALQAILVVWMFWASWRLTQTLGFAWWKSLLTIVGLFIPLGGWVVLYFVGVHSDGRWGRIGAWMNPPEMQAETEGEEQGAGD